jgi:hypothetical protein
MILRLYHDGKSGLKLISWAENQFFPEKFENIERKGPFLDFYNSEE